MKNGIRGQPGSTLPFGLIFGLFLFGGFCFVFRGLLCIVAGEQCVYPGHLVMGCATDDMRIGVERQRHVLMAQYILDHSGAGSTLQHTGSECVSECMKVHVFYARLFEQALQGRHDPTGVDVGAVQGAEYYILAVPRVPSFFCSRACFSRCSCKMGTRLSTSGTVLRPALDLGSVTRR